MKRTSAIFVLALVAIVATAQQFEMQPGAEITQINPAPIVRVRAVKDPGIYDTIDAADMAKDLAFHVKMRGSCPENHRLDALSVLIPNPKIKQSREIKLPYNSEHRSIGPEHGARWDFTTLSVPFLPPPVSPVTNCNLELRRRVSQGESQTELLRKGFDVEVPLAYKAYLNVTCKKLRAAGFHEDPLYTAETWLPLTVRCLPSDYKPPRARVEPQRTAVPDPPIESVSVAADPIPRQCPVNVTFRGKISTPANSDYSVFNTKYRFIGENNFKSDWIPVSVGRGETKTVIWRRYIQTPQTDRTGDFKTPGGRVKIPLYRGWMMVEVMLPTGSKRSERTDFIVDCNR